MPLSPYNDGFPYLQWENPQEYIKTGYWVSEAIGLEDFESPIRMLVDAITPTGTSIKIETSIVGLGEEPQYWVEQIANTIISNMPTGDLTNKFLWIRITLTSTEPGLTPEINEVTLENASLVPEASGVASQLILHYTPVILRPLSISSQQNFGTPTMRDAVQVINSTAISTEEIFGIPFIRRTAEVINTTSIESEEDFGLIEIEVEGLRINPKGIPAGQMGFPHVGNIGWPIQLVEKYEPKLFLAPRTKKYLIPLYDADNVQWNLKLGKINELTFTFPYEIEQMNDIYNIEAGKSFTPSNIIEKLQEKYLVKLQYGKYSEWFEIQSNPDTASEEYDYRTINCYSLAYELKSADVIMEYDVTSYTLLEMLKGKPGSPFSGLLENSLWQVGHIDYAISEKYRSYSTTGKNLLEIIEELSEIFACTIVYDTHNRIIDFYEPFNVGEKKGLVLDYGKYLTLLNKENDAVEICTRLKIYGNDGITIRSLNPLGTDYLEDYSHFMYPFEMDEFGNVLKSSQYDMSDELCKAILIHQEKIKDYTGAFHNLLIQKQVIQQIRGIKSIELFNLQNDLKMMKDNLAVAKQGSGQSALTQHFENEIEDIRAKILIYNQKLDDYDLKVKDLDDQIAVMQVELSEENKDNYTLEERIEKKLFTFVGNYTETAINSPEDLYKAGIEYFEERKKPRTNITIDITDFYDILDEQANWDKIVLGDIVNVFYEKFNIKNESRIVEVNVAFHSGSIALTISNVRDYEDDYDKISKMIYKNHSFSREIRTSRARWDAIQQVRSTLTEILNNPFEALQLDEFVDYTSLIDMDRIYDELEQREFEPIDIDWIPGYIDGLFGQFEFPEIELPEVPVNPEVGSGAGYLKGFIAPFDPMDSVGVDYDLWFKYLPNEPSVPEESEE